MYVFHNCLKWRGMEKFHTLTLKTRLASLRNRRLGELGIGLFDTEAMFPFFRKNS